MRGRAVRLHGLVADCMGHLQGRGVALMARPKQPDEVAERMLKLREKGWAWYAIARKFGMSQRNARRLCIDYLLRKERGDG